MLAAALALFVQTPDERVSSVTGELRIHSGFASKILGNERNLRVWLPPHYEEEKRRYPVMYLNDGQNLFDGMTSFIPNQEWRADETAKTLIEAKLLPPMILVGIDNAGAERGDEYLPTRQKYGGKADLYGRFLIEEVMPFVDKTYRTKRGPKETGLAGSSFGGVVTAYLGLRHPEVFGRLGICSPSVWWDSRVLLKLVGAMPKKTDQRVWIDMGTAESDSGVADAQFLASIYVHKGWRRGKDLAYVVEAGKAHNEAAWAGRFDSMMLFLWR
ncbi:hypothetical protein BH11ARM2_BH11ARM2_26570 [soil metagenome]